MRVGPTEFIVRPVHGTLTLVFRPRVVEVKCPLPFLHLHPSSFLFIRVPRFSILQPRIPEMLTRIPGILITILENGHKHVKHC